MNDCLDIICKEYAIVKFCKVKSTEINLSDKFVRTKKQNKESRLLMIV